MYPHAREVFPLFKGHQITWRKNTSFCSSAENLYKIRGIEDIKSALDYYEKHKQHEFCPRIFNPYDLDMKWDKLVEFSLKHP